MAMTGGVAQAPSSAVDKTSSVSRRSMAGLPSRRVHREARSRIRLSRANPRRFATAKLNQTKAMPINLDDLRHFAVARSLAAPTGLKRALQELAFVQADPIRAPARAQDLMLRHRVRDYRAGDPERRYEKLGVEEDFFVNYGFVT